MDGQDSISGQEPALSGSFFDRDLEAARRWIENKVYRPDSLPPGYHTHDEWVDRGYKPRDGELPCVALLLYSGHIDEGRYSIEQCREIRGQRAAKRRRLFHATVRARQPG